MTAKVYPAGAGPVILGRDGVARRLAVRAGGAAGFEVTRIQPGDEVWTEQNQPKYTTTSIPFVDDFHRGWLLDGDNGWVAADPANAANVQSYSGIGATIQTAPLAGASPFLHLREPGDVNNVADVTVTVAYGAAGGQGTSKWELVVVADLTFDSGVSIRFDGTTTYTVVRKVHGTVDTASTGTVVDTGWAAWTDPMTLRATYDGATRLLTVYQNGTAVLSVSMLAAGWGSTDELPDLALMPYSGFALLSGLADAEYIQAFTTGSATGALDVVPSDLTNQPVATGTSPDDAVELVGETGTSKRWNTNDPRYAANQGFAFYSGIGSMVRRGAKWFKFTAAATGVAWLRRTSHNFPAGHPDAPWIETYDHKPTWELFDSADPSLGWWIPASSADVPLDASVGGSNRHSTSYFSGQPIVVQEGHTYYVVVGAAWFAPDDFDIDVGWSLPSARKAATAGAYKSAPVVVAGTGQKTWNTKDLPGGDLSVITYADDFTGGGRYPWARYERWFTFTPTADGTATLDTMLSTRFDGASVIYVFDHPYTNVMAELSDTVYPATNAPTILVSPDRDATTGDEINGGVDNGGPPETAYLSFAVLAGHQYFVAVGRNTLTQLMGSGPLGQDSTITFRWDIP